MEQLSEAFGAHSESPVAARPQQEPAAAPRGEAERPPSPAGCCEATPKAARPAGTAPVAGECGDGVGGGGTGLRGGPAAASQGHGGLLQHGQGWLLHRHLAFVPSFQLSSLSLLLCNW